MIAGIYSIDPSVYSDETSVHAAVRLVIFVMMSFVRVASLNVTSQ